jgi:O-antigen/teichoic acid export membrane protein
LSASNQLSNKDWLKNIDDVKELSSNLFPHEHAFEGDAKQTDPPLRARVVKGATWVFASRITGRLFEIAKAVVLARLLTPEDFGLFGLVMLAMATLDILSQTGLNAALIQRKEGLRGYLDVAWTVQVVRGSLIAGILFIAAPAVGWFFHEPRVVSLLYFFCIVPILQGFINIGVVYFEKKMEFHKQFTYEAGSNIVSLVVGILLAYVLRSVWALIYANLAGVSMRLILSYVIMPYRPAFRFNWKEGMELFRFGRWMTGYGIATFCWQNIDRLILGKMLGTAALGLYQVAQRISNLPVSQIANASISFTFPAYASIQDDKHRLGKAFLDVFETLMCIVIPLTVFLVLAADDIVVGLLGKAWYEAIPCLQILAIGGGITVIDVVSTPLFISIGKPHIEFWKNLLRAGTMAVSIYPLASMMGLSGVCISYVLGALAPLPMWTGVRSIARINWQDVFSRLVPSFFLSLGTLLAVELTHAVIHESGVTSLIVAIMTSMFLFTIVAVILGKTFKRGLYHQVVRAVMSVRLAKPSTV